MRRRLFTLASAGSLVLCAATCVLWAMSWQRHGPTGNFGHEVELTDRTATPHWSAMSRAGTIVVTAFAGDGGASGGPVQPVTVPGFRYDGLRGPGGSFLFYTSSHRAVAAVFVIPPAAWAYLRWRRSRLRAAPGFPVRRPAGGERSG